MTALRFAVPELPLDGAPTDFVPDDWDRHVFGSLRGTRRILSIYKSMYELCLLEQLIDRLIAGEIYVVDSQYYASLEEYLISTEEFQKKRQYYLQKLKLPSTGLEFVNQLTGELSALLDDLNQNYETLLPYTRVSRGSCFRKTVAY
ncbi:hypothetical protein HYR99_17255 [Candidatus Poribacteria bacterium]|nr:hypothetical protein [Candidatus Poribacteria bacterium]